MSEKTQEQWIQEKAEELCVDAGYPISMAELFIPDAGKIFVNMIIEKPDILEGKDD